MQRADPQCEAKRGPFRVPVLEAYRVSFDHSHYKTTYGAPSVPYCMLGPNLEAITQVTERFLTSIVRSSLCGKLRMRISSEFMLHSSTRCRVSPG